MDDSSIDMILFAIRMLRGYVDLYQLIIIELFVINIWMIIALSIKLFIVNAEMNRMKKLFYKQSRANRIHLNRSLPRRMFRHSKVQLMLVCLFLCSVFIPLVLYIV